MKHTFNLLVTLLLAPLAANAIAPSALKTEFLENPLGIDTAMPRLSWIVKDPTTGARQTAYQVQAASSSEKLANGEADLWDSGKVASDQSHLVGYLGKSLSSLQRVFWRVKCWDQQGVESTWSTPANWTNGILRPEDWQRALWIGLRPVSATSNDTVNAWARHAARAGETHAGTAQYLAAHYPPAPFFRREFVCRQKPVRAVAVISAAGYLRLYINGNPASDRVLDPVYTNYSLHALYVLQDITAHVREGANAAGVMLGGGFYESGYSIGLKQFEYGKNGGLFGFILLEYADGSSETVVTDDSWKATYGPILKSVNFVGEAYDSRLRLGPWSEVGYDDQRWSRASVIEPLSPKLEPMTMPPERRIEILKAKKIWSPAPGIWMFDFGKNFPGWPRLRVNAAKDTTIILRCGQWTQRGPDRKIFYETPIRSNDEMINDANGTPRGRYPCSGGYAFTASGIGTEEWEPSFTYHNTRFVEVIGYPGQPDIDSVQGVVVHTDLERIGHVALGETMPQRIYDAMADTIRYVSQGNYQGNVCVERAAHLMVVYQSAATWLFTYRAESVLQNFLRGLRAGTRDGDPPEQVPVRGDGQKDLVADSAATVTLPTLAYAMGGDRRQLESHYPFMTAYIKAQERRIGDIDSFTGWGDWGDAYRTEKREIAKSTVEQSPFREIGAAGQLPVNTPIPLVTAAVYYDAITKCLKIAEVLGKAEDIPWLAHDRAELQANLNRRYYDSKAKTYGSQCADAMALAFGFAPAGDREAVAASLHRDLIGPWQGHMSGGSWGITEIPGVLSAFGYADEAYRLFTQDEYPSFGLGLMGGRNAISVRWDKHPPVARMIGNEKNGPGKWFYDYLGGIRTDIERPGFKHFILAPVFPAQLPEARVSHDSPYGRIGSAWKHEGDAVHWNITIPWNTTATIKLPQFAAGKITVNGQPQESGEFALPAGKWEIVASKKRSAK